MAPLRLVPASRLNAGEPDLVAVLNRLNCGAIILAQNGEVGVMNACAEELVGDDLPIVQQRLSAASKLHQDRLDGMLRRCFERISGGFECMLLPRRSGNRPLLLQIARLTRDTPPSEGQSNPTSALLLIFDLDRRERQSCSPALRALGLTPAEAAVAALVGAGLSPLDAADRLGIKVLTVRTHLKAIFQKLGLQRQGDLVHIVSRLSMMS